jgi:hypothetical protein
MLRIEAKDKIIREISLDKVENDTVINKEFVDDIISVVNQIYNDYKNSDDNKENDLVLRVKNNMDTTFFRSDVYDDFKGKNPKMNVYNSHETNKGMTFTKKDGELTVQHIAEKFYYSFKACMIGNSYIFLNSSWKSFCLCVILAGANLIVMLMDIFFAALFSILAAIYLGLFKIYKMLGKFHRNKFLSVFLLFFYIIKYVLAMIKGFSNIIFSIFNALNLIMRVMEETKRDFYFSERSKRNSVNRYERSVNHKFLINAISRKFKKRMAEAAIHDLSYLKKFKIQEFVLGYIDYKTLSSGLERERYKEIELAEKMNIVAVILKKSFRVQKKRWKEGVKLIYKFEAFSKNNFKNKNVEKELLENRLLLNKLSGFSQNSENVINK